ncbi:MAG TPA: sugar phosphate isomerase/epimerase [Thiotrichales bacterium]|nr:sugar phosphate isomerase/epimerase [Thiotrichales bacterium]
MKLAYSTNAYTRTDLQSALCNIAELGFAGAEILCDTPHWLSHQVSEAEIDTIKQLLNETGLAVSNLNANTANGYFKPLPPENVFEPSLSSRHKAWREWRIDYSINTLQLANSLGARCISVTSGQPGSGGSPDEGLVIFIESLKVICETAEKLGIRVGVEYEPGLLVENAAELREVIDRVDAPCLGANFDIGHSFLCGESAQSAVSLLAGRIWNVHVEDIRGGKHYHLVPGEGDLPFEDYFQALRNAGYDNYLTVELYTCSHQPEAAGRRSLDYLTPLLSAP